MFFKDCQLQKKDFFRFLLLKTAVVRSGLKPGEFLRIQHCYNEQYSSNDNFCIDCKEILALLKVDYIELRRDKSSSLILFYNKEKLFHTLNSESNKEILAKCGYSDFGNIDQALKLLVNHFSKESLPHEIGIFIGYPAKDVLGFMEKRTPIYKGTWQVFGDIKTSVVRMEFYRKVEKIAQNILERCENIDAFIHSTNHIKSNISMHFKSI